MTTVTPVPVFQGDDWHFPFTYQRRVDLVGVNLTAYSVRCQIHYQTKPVGIVINHTIELPVTMTDAVNGKFSARAARADTAGIPVDSSGRSDNRLSTHLRIILVDVDGNQTTLAKWPLRVSES